MKLSIRARAILDLREAYQEYEEIRRGLGEAFLRPVDACFALLRRDAEIYPKQYGRSRCAPLHRFPHSICYVVREGRIDVLAVSHGRRPPRRFEQDGALL